jgi:hypothetical protein
MVLHHYTLCSSHITTLCLVSASIHSVLVPLSLLFSTGNITGPKSLHFVLVLHHYTLYRSHITTLCTGLTSLHSVLVPHQYTLYRSRITTLCTGPTSLLCLASASLHSLLVPLSSFFRTGIITGPTSLHFVLVLHHYTLYRSHITTFCTGLTSLHSVLWD